MDNVRSINKLTTGFGKVDLVTLIRAFSEVVCRGEESGVEAERDSVTYIYLELCASLLSCRGQDSDGRSGG